jgi:hypothetical protein
MLGPTEATVSNGNDWQQGNGNGGNWQQGTDQSGQGGGGGGQQGGFGATSAGQSGGGQPGGGGQQGGFGATGGGQRGGQPGGGQPGGGQPGGGQPPGGQPPSSGPPSGGGGQFGGGQPPSGGGGGGGGADIITEGWGGGEEVTMDEVIERLKLVFGRAVGPVLYAWLAIAAVTLAFDLISSLLYVVRYFLDSVGARGALLTIQGIFEFASTPVYVVVGGLQWALFKPMHREIFEGEGAAGGLMDVLRSAMSVFLYTFAAVLLVSLSSSLGGVCCILPGLFLAFLLFQAPYITATQGIGPIEALKRSLNLHKMYWMLVLAVVAATFIAAGIGGCVGGVFTFILGLVASVIRPFDSPFMTIFAWLGIQLAMFAIFVVHSTVFSLIESKETGAQPAA